MLGAPVRIPLAGTRPEEPALRRDHEIVRVRMERLRDDLLADGRPVGVGGVDEVDAELERAPQDGLALVAVAGLAPDPVAREAHGAEAEAIDGQLTAEGEGS